MMDEKLKEYNEYADAVNSDSDVESVDIDLSEEDINPSTDKNSFILEGGSRSRSKSSLSS
jgi:hypothetical protein